MIVFERFHLLKSTKNIEIGFNCPEFEFNIHLFDLKIFRLGSEAKINFHLEIVHFNQISI
jgi:hypothetical protein